MTKRDRRDFPPIHPGEMLLEEFMKPLNLSQNALAEALHVPVTRINQICQGKRGISGDTALRLARYFGNSAQFWMNLQAGYELEVAKDEAAEAIDREVRPRASA